MCEKHPNKKIYIYICVCVEDVVKKNQH
jgi:hypothetical protein